MDHENFQKETDHLSFLVNRFMVLGFIVHFLWIPLFIWLDIYILGMINVFSALTYLLGLFLNRKNYTFAAISFGHIEILIHAFFATIVLGPRTGFPFYILDALIVTFIASKPKLGVKAIVLIMDIVFFVLLYQYSGIPLIKTDEVIIKSLFVMNAVSICLTLAIVTHYFRSVTLSAEKNLIKLNRKLEILANTDPLTELLNRRTMISIIEKQVEEYKIKQVPFTIVIADIDDFKKFNDTNGHLCGDFVLQECSKLLEESLSENDYISRWGGEEFLILLHDAELNKANKIIERIKHKFKQKRFSYEGVSLQIALTFGLTEYNDLNIDIFRCINNADKALLYGKGAGKNCIITFDHQLSQVSSNTV